jgi:hypothetical protein
MSVVATLRRVTFDLETQRGDLGLNSVEFLACNEVDSGPHVLHGFLCSTHGVARGISRALRGHVALITKLGKRLFDGILERANDTAYRANTFPESVSRIRPLLSFVCHGLLQCGDLIPA